MIFNIVVKPLYRRLFVIFWVIFRNNFVNCDTQIEASEQQIETSGQQIETSGQQKLDVDFYKKFVIEFCNESRTALEIKNMLKIKSRQYISTYILRPLIKEGKLEYTNKNSVNARNQKYKSL